MDYKFSEIVLLKDELKILKKIKKANLKIENESVLHALKSYKLIEEVYADVDENFNLIHDGTYKIHNNGKRYLIYLKRIRKNTFWEWFRYIITTLIAVCALIRTFQ